MKAIIIIGDRGARLRPLLPVLNRPFLGYQLEVLSGHVEEGLLCASDPAPFRCDRKGIIAEFVEKPSAVEVDTNLVNAVAYVFDRSVMCPLEPGHSSLERELFPALLAEGMSTVALAGGSRIGDYSRL